MLTGNPGGRLHGVRDVRLRDLLHGARRVPRALPGLLVLLTSCAYMKMNPPPDVDKSPFPPSGADQSCWQATAANMLAGAGYGDGSTVQQRADDIYGELTAQFGLASGWTDAALSWWLASANNTWPANPYSVVTVYGNKSPKIPWNNANGAEFIGNELRRCQMVGLSISWPTDEPYVVGSGGHAITCWGDELGGNTASLATNPETCRVTDSDNEDGGDVQVYDYDVFTSPNPGGANEGNGWYIDYDPNHPYIKHIVTLCPTDDPSDTTQTQKVVGSYKIHQDEKADATDLHYRVGTDVNILSYWTRISWDEPPPPQIQENGPPNRELQVDWDLTKHPIPYCNWITITTEFVLPSWNAIKYSDVHFTYPTIKKQALPDLEWKLDTPFMELKQAAALPNVTGGYVIGAFDILNPDLPAGQQIVGEYRLVHQYSFNQLPEQHRFQLTGTSGFAVANLRFGHSYGYPAGSDLWKFEQWMTQQPGPTRFAANQPIEVSLDWAGRLPYPEGEDTRGRIPGKKR